MYLEKGTFQKDTHPSVLIVHRLQSPRRGNSLNLHRQMNAVWSQVHGKSAQSPKCEIMLLAAAYMDLEIAIPSEHTANESCNLMSLLFEHTDQQH